MTAPDFNNIPSTPPAPPARSNTLAIVALVCSLFCSLVGLILGIIAVGKYPAGSSGKTMSIIAIVISILGMIGGVYMSFMK